MVEKIILKLVIQNGILEHRSHSFGSVQGPVADFCVFYNETSGSIDDRGFLGQLRRYGQDSSGPGWDCMVSSYEHGNEPSGSTESGECLDQLSDC
jgi:hypothetical protein